MLYSSGELFHVDTTTGACRPTRWVPGRSGYELFGMGFVADAAGRERLYIAGGSISQLDRADGRVALLDMASLEPTSLGSHPRGNHSPELSGTADGRLFAFYPGEKLTHLDVSGGRGLSSWRLPRGAGGRVKAWAFAHWGGAFYLFATESLGSLGGDQRNRVYRFDPTSGTLATVVGASPYQITGAGVSTCAPTR